MGQILRKVLKASNTDINRKNNKLINFCLKLYKYNSDKTATMRCIIILYVCLKAECRLCRRGGTTVAAAVFSAEQDAVSA